jgi:hypothetical protein
MAHSKDPLQLASFETVVVEGRQQRGVEPKLSSLNARVEASLLRMQILERADNIVTGLLAFRVCSLSIGRQVCPFRLR